MNFKSTSGSIIGSEHIRISKNNQDAYTLIQTDNLIAGIVCDGCSAGDHTEVGSKLTAMWLKNSIEMHSDMYLKDDKVNVGKFVSEVHMDLLSSAKAFVVGLSPFTVNRVDPFVVHHYMLTTYLVYIITPSTTFIFGTGDGMYNINGINRVLEPEEGNRPIYYCYGLLPEDSLMNIIPDEIHPKTHVKMPTSEVDRIFVATDGLEYLSTNIEDRLPNGKPQGSPDQFYDLKYFENTTLVTKRLNFLSTLTSRLKDDASTVLSKRVEDDQ